MREVRHKSSSERRASAEKAHHKSSSKRRASAEKAHHKSSSVRKSHHQSSSERRASVEKADDADSDSDTESKKMGEERHKSSSERRAAAEKDDADSDSDNESKKIREECHKSSSERRDSAEKSDDADNDSDSESRKIEQMEKLKEEQKAARMAKILDERAKIELQKKKLEEKQKAARMAKILAERDEEEYDRDSGHEFNYHGAAKPVSDYDAAEEISAGLGGENLQSTNSEGRRAHKQADEKAETDARRNAYQNAVNTAEHANMVLREKIRAENVGDEDEEFYRSLDRDRKSALKNQRNSVNPNRRAESVVARLASLQQDEQEAVSSSQPPAGIESQEERLIFTVAGEFCRSKQLDDALIRRAGRKDVHGNEEEEVPVEKTEEGTSKQVGEGCTEIVVTKKHRVDEEETDRGHQVKESVAEVSVGRGLAGALSLLQQRGTLKETADWGGRNMDKKRSKLVGVVDECNNKIGQRDIVLDRLDEFGRTMTPKEAFRRISHAFHGRGPGKMKKAKKIKQFQEELRLKQMNAGDTPLLSMEKIREAQAKMHTPYIVISGHIKPGQTSDPRSGFGTVEKESIGSLTPMLGDRSAGSLTAILGDKSAGSLTPMLGNKSAGSLTPMLGDKKVEHFLGIKRKPAAGFKIPPPKQSKFGQTSDPRSGFGTVEKEPIGSLTSMLGDKSAGSLTPVLGDKSAGSLTPMLGDKTVEHFLGIKRKSVEGFKILPPRQSKFAH